MHFFNDASYGPYRGSIISVSWPGCPSEVRTAAFDFPGVYWRHFRWQDAATLWTVSLSALYAMLLSSILPVVWLRRRLTAPGPFA